ncbi:hypothetical protein [Candidatus Nanohalococcus occultus]|uniref:Uncharacterized protein n=1 Tax=Candidatus Nanohalococcus occultus TaxID=2978047 RepID=A0ABY8CIH0_9ARCH|nr:hypothetical protein SVXNc_0453 [Candidatus Nanohaloarchaeota archaeon SVXNc]
MNVEKIEDWFGGKLDVLSDGSEYPIFLVAIGEKPAALTMNVDDRQEKTLRELCSELDLAIKVSEGRVSKPGVAVGNRPEHDQRCAFITNDESRMEILENSSGRFYGFSDEAVGRFLGFPDSAIEFFEENEQPGMVSKKAVMEKDPDGKKFLALTTFIPAPESLKEAVEIGKRRKDELESFDRENNSSLGEEFIQRRFEGSLY